MGIEKIVKPLFGGALLGGAMLQKDATQEALAAQEQGRNQSDATLRHFFDTTRRDNQPLMELRNALLPRIQGLAEQGADVSPQDVMADPGYQFGLNQGRQAVQGSAAARGGLHSGRTLQALNQFGNDYGTSKYGEVFNRRQAALGSNFGRAMSAAGLGQGGVQQTQSVGQNTTNSLSNNAIGFGNALAAQKGAEGQIYGNLLNRASSYATGGFF